MTISKIPIWDGSIDIYLIKNESSELKTFEFIGANNIMRGGVDKKSYRYMTSVTRSDKYTEPYFSVKELICREGSSGKIIGHYSSSPSINPFFSTESIDLETSYSKSKIIQATSFRKAADSQSSVIKRFRVGDIVEVIDCSNTWWCKVKHQNTIGWVKKRLIEVD